MSGYILSILGIVICGIIIDIVIPSGSISKYIKSIYSIFVVAVLISPVVKLLHNKNDLTIKYDEYVLNDKLLSYIYSSRVTNMEKNLTTGMEKEGFKNIDINLTFSIENNELKYNFCKVNIKNLVISPDKLHINKYEFIKNTIKDSTNLTDEEIIIDEW